jgi:hypothetical protein
MPDVSPEAQSAWDRFDKIREEGYVPLIMSFAKQGRAEDGTPVIDIRHIQHIWGVEGDTAMMVAWAFMAAVQAEAREEEWRDRNKN